MELRRRLKMKLKTLMGDQTQEVFAGKIGIGQGSLNRILKGRQDVGLDLIERVCKFTGITVEDLLGGNELNMNEMDSLHSLESNSATPSVE